MALHAESFSNELTSLIETLAPSVVRVEGPIGRPASGTVYGPRHIITVARATGDGPVNVVLDGHVYPAKLVGRDAGTDLAILEVEPTVSLAPAKWAESAEIKVGQVVLRLGRPGDSIRATSGIMSTVGSQPVRLGRGGEVARYLESDAACPPGFSGGPLVSLDGSVMGVNSRALVRGQHVTIPAITVRQVAEQLLAHGKVRKSWLGLFVQPLTLPGEVAAATGEEVGLLVTNVEKGGPADFAGIAYGDTLLHLGDSSVRTFDDVRRYLETDRSGQQVPVKLLRAGAVSTVQLTIGAR